MGIAENSEKGYSLHIPLALRRNSPGAVSMCLDEQMMGHSEVILVVMSILLVMIIISIMSFIVDDSLYLQP